MTNTVKLPPDCPICSGPVMPVLGRVVCCGGEGRCGTSWKIPEGRVRG